MRRVSLNRVFLVGLLTVGVIATARSMASHAAPGGPTSGIKVSTLKHRGHLFTIVTVDPAVRPMQLATRPGGVTLTELEQDLRTQGKRPLVAMNAGMYVDEIAYAAVGLSVTSGKALHPVNTANATGNFFLKPNGVFYVDGLGPHVVTTEEYLLHEPESVRIATQSGPMLVIPTAGGSKVHPRFSRLSTNVHVRNGVGMCGGKAVFAISHDEVNLHQLATLFSQPLHCDSALYLDGTVSALIAPGVDQGATRRRWGGLLYVDGPL